MITPQDEPFLRRALRLAMNGRGHVEPNPMVGCVLVKNGQIIGEGWHQEFGGPHAEPNALADCKSRGNDPAGATAYVTLEPCCHENKKTPPCAPRLIEAKIARVVIGCLDPNPDVNGKGVAMLRAAGIAVDILPSSSRSRSTGFQPVSSDSVKKSQVRNLCYEVNGSHFQQLIAPFIRLTTHELPWYTMKWAETADGTVSGPEGARLQISNPAINRIVHQLRTRSDAIAVGIGTVLKDDPLLTARGVPIIRVPRRYVLDTRLRIPLASQLVRTARETPTIVLSSVQHREDAGVPDHSAALRNAGVIVDDNHDVEADDRLSLSEVLYSSLRVDASLRYVNAHVLVEAGPTLAREMLGMTDRLWVIRSKSVRSPLGLKAASIPPDFVPTGSLTVDGDTLTEYFSNRSETFFAGAPSADFVLAAEEAGSPVA